MNGGGGGDSAPPRKKGEMAEKYIAEDKTVEGAKELVIAGETIVFEEACTFKTIEAASAITRLLGMVDLTTIVPELATISRDGNNPIIIGFLVQKLIPMIGDEVPEALLKLAALMSIPNRELKKAYGKPNGVKGLVEEKKAWLLFEAPPDTALRIVTEYVPYLGLEGLKNALGPLIQVLSGLMPQVTMEVEGEEEGPDLSDI